MTRITFVLCLFSAHWIVRSAPAFAQPPLYSMNVEGDCLFAAVKPHGHHSACSGSPSFGISYSEMAQSSASFTGNIGIFPGLSSRDTHRPAVLSSSDGAHTSLWQYVGDAHLEYSVTGPWSIGLGIHNGVARPQRKVSQRLQGLLLEGEWRQFAADLSYRDHRMSTSLFLGQGEGELMQEDIAGYIGVAADAWLSDGVHIVFGASWDGDNRGSDQAHSLKQWAVVAPGVRQEFSTERFLLALVLDGKLPSARGLELTALWQQTKFQDSSSADLGEYKMENYPTQLDGYFGPLYYEVGGHLNTSVRSVYEIDASYRILDAIIVGASVSTASISLDQSKSFVTCREVKGGLCAGPGPRKSALSQTSWSGGIGFDWRRIVTVQWEYAQIAFDELYSFPHFRAEGGDGARTQSLQNVGLVSRYQF